MIGIYGIFRKSDDKCVYVGESTNIDYRIRTHLNGRSKIHLNKDMYYGKVLEEHNIDNHLYRLQRESFWINKLNAELNFVRNACWPESYKLKMSVTMTGKHHTNESKEKIGAAKKGKHWKIVDGKRVWYD